MIIPDTFKKNLRDISEGVDKEVSKRNSEVIACRISTEKSGGLLKIFVKKILNNYQKKFSSNFQNFLSKKVLLQELPKEKPKKLFVELRNEILR